MVVNLILHLVIVMFSCTGVDPTLFAYNLRVRTNCRLYLIMSYCGEDPGCVCIWRSDYRLNAEVSNFAAVAGDASVRLNWSTASETDNAQFRITRSEDRDGIYNTVLFKNRSRNIFRRS